MNLLLLHPEEIATPGRALIRVSRYPPRAGLWPPAPGRQLRVGLLDGCIGTATVEQVNEGVASLAFELRDPPPAPRPLTLLLALPRPKTLRRVLRCAAELGIKTIWLLNATRVEKSYWQSPLLTPDRLRDYCAAGLEQAIDTVMPAVELRPRLKPFVQDELDTIAAGSTRLVAHPGAAAMATAAPAPVTLAIGPEGGFTDYEIGLFGEAGFSACSLGPRVLRVETALPVLAATLLPARD